MRLLSLPFSHAGVGTLPIQLYACRPIARTCTDIYFRVHTAACVQYAPLSHRTEAAGRRGGRARLSASLCSLMTRTCTSVVEREGARPTITVPYSKRHRNHRCTSSFRGLIRPPTGLTPPAPDCRFQYARTSARVSIAPVPLRVAHPSDPLTQSPLSCPPCASAARGSRSLHQVHRLPRPHHARSSSAHICTLRAHPTCSAHVPAPSSDRPPSGARR